MQNQLKRGQAVLFFMALVLGTGLFSCKNQSVQDIAETGHSHSMEMTAEEIEKIKSDTAMIDHTDWNWERIKNNPTGSNAIAASHYISRCSAGNPYMATYPGQTSPGQGATWACQSFAAAMAHNEYRTRKWGGTCLNAQGIDLQRSPWHIWWRSRQVILNFFNVSTPMNVLYNYGCTHLFCMYGWDGAQAAGDVRWRPDPRYGVNTLADIHSRALVGRINDKSWSWVGGSNTSTIPPSNCANYNLDQNQIRNALANGRVVLLRFSLLNGIIPIIYNYGLSPNVPVFHTQNNCNKVSTSSHVVAILGYDDATRLYRIQNSWGATNNMDGMGSFWMTYDAVTARADQANYINW